MLHDSNDIDSDFISRYLTLLSRLIEFSLSPLIPFLNPFISINALLYLEFSCPGMS